MSTETITELNPQPEIDEALRKWLADYIAAHPEHTTAVLARADYIGMSRRALDAYLSGRYFLPREEGGEGGNPASSRLEPAIRAFRSRVQSLDQHGNLGTFVETGTWKYLQHACDTAINENAIVVIYGRPGVGKTRCLMEYASRRMTTLPKPGSAFLSTGNNESRLSWLLFWVKKCWPKTMRQSGEIVK